MISEEKLFGNLFDDEKITPERLFHFGQKTIIKLVAGNIAARFDGIITTVTDATNALGVDLGLVDTNLNTQLGKTQIVNTDVKTFKTYMSSHYDEIARKLGGVDDPRMLEFYPHKRTEYTNATQGEMETLTHRVHEAADINHIALGIDLTTELEAFYAPWVSDKAIQTVQMTTVGDNRALRNDNFVVLGLALTEAVHVVAATFPGDVATCKTFFKFSDLFAHHHQTTILFSGSIDAGKQIVIENRLYTDSMSIYVKNTSINADLFAYLAFESGDLPTAVGVKVKATRGTQKVPSKYGDLTNTFFSLENQSIVNPVTYIVKITF